MLRTGAKELFTVLLAVLVSNPSIMIAASTEAAPRNVLGSIASHGSVRVGETQMPAEGTLFAGDRVETTNGSALIQYRDGARIVLVGQSQADFAPAHVQLSKGLMTFQTVSGDGLVFAASTLRLEPASPRTAANVTVNDNKATVAVTEGTLKVVDPSGVQLASLRVGDARLFEEAPASSPEPAAAAPPAAPPQSGGAGSSASSNHKWLLALGVAAAGTAVGVAALVRANDANSHSDSQAALVSQIQAQNAALTSQVSSLRAQAASVNSFLSSLSAASAQQQAALVDLSATLADLATIESQLSALQQQTSQLLTQIAQNGGQATSAQLAQLQSLLSQQSGFNTRLQSDTAKITADSTTIRNNAPPPFSPTAP